MNPQDQPNLQNPNEPPQPLSQPQPQPPTQSPTAPPQNPSYNPGQPLTTQPTPDPLSYMQPTKPNYQRPLLIATGVLLVLLVLAGIGLSMAGKDTSNSSQQPKNSQATNTENINAQPNTEPVAALAGYVPLDKLCYTIQIPKDNDAGEENDCLFSARLGEEGLTSITVTSFIKYNESMDSNVANFKASEAKLGSTTVSEENIKIGGLDAKKVITKGKGTYALTTAHIFVGTDKYKVDGVKVTGFEIIAPSYDMAENKKIIDNIIASWQWK